MIDSNTKFEIQNEVEILCQDMRMLTIVTNRLFDPVIHPDKLSIWREPDGYR